MGGHDCEDAFVFVENEEHEILESFQLTLSALLWKSRRRSTSDEFQVDSIVRALLVLSGSDVDRHEISKDYTAKQNANLCASILGIELTSHFDKFDTAKMCGMLSRSPAFYGISTDPQIINNWRTRLNESLFLGFQEDYMVSLLEM